MKTIIKYELVINEALRSALNYDTPDEQINEFSRFFGKMCIRDRTGTVHPQYYKSVTAGQTMYLQADTDKYIVWADG